MRCKHVVEIGHKKEVALRIKKFLIAIVALFAVLAAINMTHQFGPFMGKVVDAETGEPIEGAAVLISFYIETGTMGGTVYTFLDAVETLTDSQGEFRFAPKRINRFHIFSSWSDDCQISIFKPGYSAYPGHSQAYSSWEKAHSWFIPEDKNITYYLKRLYSLEEKKNNLRNIEYPAGITNDKANLLKKLESKERVNVGLKP